MQKPNLTKICRSVKTATVKHSPEILTGVGIAGMVTTTVWAGGFELIDLGSEY